MRVVVGFRDGTEQSYDAAVSADPRFSEHGALVEYVVALPDGSVRYPASAVLFVRTEGG